MIRFINMAAAAASILLICACTQKGTLTVETADGSRTRLEAMNPKIIRVSSVPSGSEFSRKASLCVLPGKARVKTTVTRTDSCVTFSTGEVIAKISLESGCISFSDTKGNIYTAESGRSFSPFTADGVDAWTVQQTFDSPDDEAFYGLGQHQADEWNYKGRNEELYQYNTKISIPFIVSTRGYGILWDSYSFCRWGDTRDYARLCDVFRLYGKDGSQGGLTGTYTPAQGQTLIRRETGLDQEFLVVPKLEKVGGAPEGFKFNGSHVEYDGFLEAPESGIYRFLLYYAGYTKVFVDGKEVVPQIWRTAWNPNSHKFQVEMEAGKKTPVHVSWDPDGDVSYCALKVLSPRDESEQAKMSWWGEMQDQIDYYFIAGDTPDGVISGYRALTGKAPIMPKWAMGFWQCRERYRTQDELLSTFREMRDRGIPVDNIVQDWQYWEPDQWGSHEFDHGRYPDPKAMVDSVHAMGGHLMLSVWPKFYKGTEHFNELDAKGWIYRQAITDTVRDWLGYEQSFYDAYAPGARKLFWGQMKEHLLPLGIDAWWMDASEPNIHDCTDMDYRKALCGPTYLGPSAQYFNAYALMNAMAIYEGQRDAIPDKRVFLLTRSGFPGIQRYATASWSGDIGTRWEDMKTQISAGLNYSMSGIPYWTQDIGGFSVEGRYYAAAQRFYDSGEECEDLREWRELQTRWHQMGMFNPLYRVHGQYPNRELWNVAPEGTETYEAILECDRMRYTLMPYIYTLAARTWFDDYTIMRPLVMDFTDDVTARGISDQFLFGDAIMVCPVYTYKARSKEIYLPEGIWYDLHDGFNRIEGGRYIQAQAPYDHIPVYARAGQIVVTGPKIQYSSQPQDGSLDIYVFSGKDATFSLYEDDGLTYDYEKGSYSIIPIRWDESERSLTIGSREGSFEGMAESRSIRVHIINADGETILPPSTYNGTSVKII